MATLSSHIYIIGAGAIGRSLAVILQNQRKEVTLVKVRPHAPASHKEIISLTLPDASEMTAGVSIAGIADIPAYAGIILLTTKSYVNPDIAHLLKNKTGSSPLIILQNGLGVEKYFWKIISRQYTAASYLRQRRKQAQIQFVSGR